MKEEKNVYIKEKLITIEDIPKINPNTIAKIILLDGTTLLVQKESSTVDEQKSKKQELNNDKSATDNLRFKLKQIPNSNEKPKNRFSYIEWDFPGARNNNHSFQRNLENDLRVSRTEQNEDNNKKENSRDSAINRNRRTKNYAFYESKHTSKKKENKENNESKNTSGLFVKNEENFNFKEIISNKDNNVPQIPKVEKENEKEKQENKYNNNEVKKINLMNDNNNQKNKSEVLNVKNNEKKEKKEKKEELNNNKKNKDNLTFSEKIKLIKYGLLDYDSSFTGVKTEENNIQKINKVKPLNIMFDKNKNRNEEDLDKQFNKLLNKFNENKTNKKTYDDNSYFANKNNGREINLNDDINRLNNIIHKNKFNYTFKNDNNKGNSYRDLNQRINQLKKKTLNNTLINYLPNNTSKVQRMKMLVLPSNFK